MLPWTVTPLKLSGMQQAPHPSGEPDIKPILLLGLLSRVLLTQSGLCYLHLLSQHWVTLAASPSVAHLDSPPHLYQLRYIVLKLQTPQLAAALASVHSRGQQSRTRALCFQLSQPGHDTTQWVRAATSNKLQPGLA